jgi:hypothetical protein
MSPSAHHDPGGPGDPAEPAKPAEHGGPDEPATPVGRGRAPVQGLGARFGPKMLGLAGLALAVILAAFFLGRGFSGEDGPAAAPPGGVDGSLGRAAAATPVPGRAEAAPARVSRSAPSGRLTAPPWTGRVRRTVIGSASAGCTADPGVDAGGRRVGYAAGNVLDRAERTAWRCDGDGRGVTLRLTLPRPKVVAAVGLVPGYAKTDPFNGVDRYAQNRRIARVRWSFDDGTWVEQTLDTRSTVRRVQTMRIPPVRTRHVALTIVDSVPAPRNTVAVSTVRLATKAAR